MGEAGGGGGGPGGDDPCRAHPLPWGLGSIWIGPHPAPALRAGRCLLRGSGRRRRFSANELDSGGPRGRGPVRCPDAPAWNLAPAIAERRWVLGSCLARRLAGLGVRRECKGKPIPEEARSRDRRRAAWGAPGPKGVGVRLGVYLMFK